MVNSSGHDESLRPRRAGREASKGTGSAIDDLSPVSTSVTVGGI